MHNPASTPRLSRGPCPVSAMLCEAACDRSTRRYAYLSPTPGGLRPMAGSWGRLLDQSYRSYERFTREGRTLPRDPQTPYGWDVVSGPVSA